MIDLADAGGECRAYFMRDVGSDIFGSTTMSFAEFDLWEIASYFK